MKTRSPQIGSVPISAQTKDGKYLVGWTWAQSTRGQFHLFDPDNYERIHVGTIATFASYVRDILNNHDLILQADASKLPIYTESNCITDAILMSKLRRVFGGMPYGVAAHFVKPELDSPYPVETIISNLERLAEVLKGVAHEKEIVDAELRQMRSDLGALGRILNQARNEA